MLDLLLSNGRVLAKSGLLSLGYVGIAGGRIATVGAGHPDPVLVAQHQIDLAGATVAPGLIDLHMHGGDDHDAMDATPAALEGMARHVARHGVTAFLAATMSSSHGPLIAALENIRAAMGRDLGGAQLLGSYVEGPYLSPSRAGAHDPATLRQAAQGEIEAILQTGAARVVVLAPEPPGAMEAIERLVGEGVVVALGHTTASYEQMVAAAEAGASLVTHLFNAMAPLHHREPGPIGAALTITSLTCELIADLVHLHPAILRLALQAKGASSIALVTDAMRGAGLPDGRYSLGGLPVVVAEGSARLEDGRLAGSVLTMDRAVANMAEVAGLPLEEAWTMASQVPARVLGLSDRKGAIAEGMDADLAVWGSRGEILATLVGGRLVYHARSTRKGARSALDALAQ
jgi:N-acetylglucosamine-6-phosphate deacetylase